MLNHTESPFWAIDEDAKSKFGYNIGLENLELSKNSIIQIASIIKLFHQRLNPVYQMFPSLWSGRMNVFFQMFLKKTLSKIEQELGNKYELINGECDLMNEEINIEQIDKDLKEFLQDPSKYADKKGIIYKSKEALNKEIQAAYEDWKNIEFKWTTI